MLTTALCKSAFPSPKQNSHCNKHECSEKYEHIQIDDVTFGHEKKAYEKIEKSRNELSLSSKNTTLLQIKPEFLMQALPHVAMFMKHGLQSERDLIGSMEFLAKMKGISFQALEEAKETIRKDVLSFAIKESTLGD
ncbi:MULTISPECIES: hypothetical protein [unclassified Bartonella]|uniref:hypothetical protein n=1 Tax=unclassified Bartonella TaxID=2645622 RepID=UPI0035CFAC53